MLLLRVSNTRYENLYLTANTLGIDVEFKGLFNEVGIVIGILEIWLKISVGQQIVKLIARSDLRVDTL